MIAESSERPIKLIGIDNDGKYTLSEEGIAFISQIKTPVAVISVAGMYRTGKSYLLNRMLLNRSDGFGVGPTVNPCTKGLWCWGKTIPGKTPEGASVNVLIIDTEGIGALDQDQTHDTRIFTLAILASSSFIYNSTGSIDENALQNLSLVVNLTKNIQLHASQDEEQDDPEDLSEHFPAFFWVVRDFSLQLINSQGDHISSKQYLERALAPQKGFSDDVEQKNRIRRCLSSFFKERDCITLVRPLVNEKKLQSLETLGIEQIRPEFIDQVMNFRRRILGRIRPKTFKGKQLDGKMYICILNSYLNAINNGAVPNIENAWNYMCQQKCAMAFEQSLSLFNEEAEKILKSSFPVEQQYLLQQLNKIGERACDVFESKSIGDNTKFHMKQLRNKLQNKIQNIKQENEQESQIILKSYFKKSIGDIENRLRMNEYENFQKFMGQLNGFYAEISQNGPNLPKKQTIYLKLLKKVIPTAAQIFLKQKSRGLETIQAAFGQKEQRLSNSIQALKKEISELECSYKEKLSKADHEKIELQFELQQKNKFYLEEKQAYEGQMQRKNEEMKQLCEEYDEKQKQYSEKIRKYQNDNAMLNEEVVAIKYENEKLLAISQLKIKQQQLENQQGRRRIGELEIQIKSLEMKRSEQLKEMCEVSEGRLRAKDMEIRQLRGKVQDLEQSLQSYQTDSNKMSHEYQQEIDGLKKQLSKKAEYISNLVAEQDQRKSEIKQEYEQKLAVIGDELSSAVNRVQQLEKQLKTIGEQMAACQNKFQATQALNQQKLQFTTIQSQELRSRIKRQKQEHEMEFAKIALQLSQKRSESLKQAQVLQQYQSKIESFQISENSHIKQIEEQKQQILMEISELKSQIQNIKQKHGLQIEEYNKKVRVLQEQIEMKDSMISENGQIIQQEWRSKQRVYTEKIQKLLQEIEMTKQELLREQRQEHEKSEESVLQLKNYYELEKQKLENKIIFERQKYDKKISNMQLEYDEKIKEQTTLLEEQFEVLKERFFEIEEELNKQRNNKKIEIDIKNKNIENLEKNLHEVKAKLEEKEVEYLGRIEKMQKQQYGEKQGLYAKIEEHLAKQSKLQKQKSSLLHMKEQLEKVIVAKDQSIVEWKEEVTNYKTKLEANKQEVKSMKTEMTSKLMEQRVEFTKKMALFQQQNQYLKIKIEEQQKSQLSYLSETEEKIKKIREQSQSEVKILKQKSQADFEALESKYEKLKKSSKQKDSNQQKSITTLQKDLAISQQKIANLTEKLQKYETKQQCESEQFNNQIGSLKLALNKDRQKYKEMLEQEIKEKEKLESERNSILASCQQEIMLLENKNKFLEEGKERYKLEYEETKSKLEVIIEANRKKWQQEKNMLEAGHNQYISKLEKKHWQQKQETIENIKKKQSDLENKVRTLTAQIMSLNEKLSLEEQNKMGNQSVSDRKLKQMIENQKRLQNELERLRSQRENEQQQIQNQEKEKDNVKLKLKEKQDQYRSLQRQKQHLFYEIEKQRAKWNMEKQNFVNKNEEQKDLISKYERDIEKLQRENEKLKVEKKCQKSGIHSMTRYSSNFSLEKGGLSRSSLEESILKENNSQVSDTSLFFKD